MTHRLAGDVEVEAQLLDLAPGRQTLDVADNRGRERADGVGDLERLGQVEPAKLPRQEAGREAVAGADRISRYTDGSRTWIDGPVGVQVRGNNERFRWELVQR